MPMRSAGLAEEGDHRAGYDLTGQSFVPQHLHWARLVVMAGSASNCQSRQGNKSGLGTVSKSRRHGWRLANLQCSSGQVSVPRDGTSGPRAGVRAVKARD